jgi:DnaJ-class molecular chaperone
MGNGDTAPCPFCEGTGRVQKAGGGFKKGERCPPCVGTGEISKHSPLYRDYKKSKKKKKDED